MSKAWVRSFQSLAPPQRLPRLSPRIPVLLSLLFSLLLSLLLLPLGCRSNIGSAVSPAAVTDKLDLKPSNHRQWEPNLAVLPYAEFNGDEVTIRHIRNCRYITEDDYLLDEYDATFKFSDLMSVDFLVVPFKDAPDLAHTMLSFGFRDHRYLAVSVEARMELGEKYTPTQGAFGQYELMYVIADERDVIPLRTEHRNVDVYLYPGRNTPEQRRALLRSMLERANRLIDEPEFYDTFTNNCTTNLVRHINELNPGRIPLDLRVLLPGQSDRLAYELGLLDRTLPFDELKQRSRVNPWVATYLEHPNFSTMIRQQLRRGD